MIDKKSRDVAAIKQLLNEGEIEKSSVMWCSWKEQLGDCMTKRGAHHLGI